MPGYDLDLDANPKTAVFRAIDNILRTDPTLARIIPRNSFTSWKGEEADRKPFAGITQLPAIRLTPVNGPESWWNPAGLRGDLLIQVELLVKGTNVDNVNNLWWAIERALYPKDQALRFANVKALQQAGALTGISTFSLPASDPDPNGAFFYARGQIKVAVNLQLDP